jgi:hypothetical protein
MERQFALILLVLVGMVAASAGVVAFTMERLHDAVEPRSTTTLEACLADNMVPDLTAAGEELINQACSERARDRSSTIAACIFEQRDKLTSDDAARAAARQCGLKPDPDAL